MKNEEEHTKMEACTIGRMISMHIGAHIPYTSCSSVNFGTTFSS